MALTDEGNGSGMVMPVAPMGGGYGYGGNGLFGGDGSWLILFLIFAMFGGGWGMGGFGGFNGGFGIDFPWLLNGQNAINANTNAGFDHAATQSAISGLQQSVTAGFGDVQLGLAGVNQAICQTGNGIVASVTGAQNALAQQMYSNQIADLERSFAAQTANTQGLNALQGQLAQCCCDNRLATAQTQALVQAENCADREALSNGIRDIISSQTASTQAILDKMCQLELDGYKRENDQLRTQLNFANLQASQVAQTAELRQSNATNLNNLVSELRSCPIPSQPVYGNQPIFTCGGSGCGCGM